MKKSLSKALGVNGFEVTDVFSKEDGEEFLAQELGFMKVEELPTEGAGVAELCGYQKVALMLVAGMVAPVSKKKRKWSWSEVGEYLKGCRTEVEKGEMEEEVFKDVEEGGVGGGVGGGGFDWGAV